jgi:hypothetical protein
MSPINIKRKYICSVIRFGQIVRLSVDIGGRSTRRRTRLDIRRWHHLGRVADWSHSRDCRRRGGRLVRHGEGLRL